MSITESQFMRLKLLLNYFIIFLFTGILLEVSCFMVFKTLSGKTFAYDSLEQERLARIASLQDKLRPQTESQAQYIFHPYVGYVSNPGRNTGEKILANEYGMRLVSGHPYPYKRKDNEFVIAVVGGSVAAGFANRAEQALRENLQAIHFPKKPILINLALGGYKQPQQLFHLQYALLSGFEFDAVLNIDGFNDLVLASENIESHINPLFPSGFHIGLMAKMYMDNRFDFPTTKQLYNYYALHRTELRLLSWIQKAPFKYSIFMNLLGELWTNRNVIRIKELEYTLAHGAQETLPKAFRGPTLPQTTDNPYVTVTNLWKNASQLLYGVSRANHLVYIHVLQPNQYVSGSKILTDNEKARAFDPQNKWSIHAQKGYSYLIAAGKQLKEENFPFHDLTMIFKDYPDDLYVDVCCHYQNKGDEIMAKHIADILMYETNKQIFQ